ncbi:nestin [Heteronotia binoei]|uniref:nestin n=1 Tax=Heteronotia binoei TaxID=13085 RepID=UPI002931960D|nr:nestin [Heteronotia binoei]
MLESTLLEAAGRPLGEASLQMWELNKRLEAYLARVKALEEENEGLAWELQRLRGSPGPAGEQAGSWWRARCEEEVGARRAELDEAFRQKSAAELARAGVAQELQRLQSRCQKERAAREEAKRLLAASKQQLEEEKRGHLWLQERAGQLQKELHAAAQAHLEERARLEHDGAAGGPWRLESCRPPGPPFPAGELEDYSRRLSELWRGAVDTYQAEVSQLQASLRQAKENLCEAAERNRHSHLQLQQLEKELAALQGRKETLRQRLAHQWQHQQGEAHKLQLAVEGLEEEKQGLALRIAQVLEEQRQLMHLKMSLSLEVATYRTLLEAESTRLQMPAAPQVALSPPESKWEAASKTKRQAASLGSRDPWPSPTTFLKAGVTPPLPKSQSGPFRLSTASGLPKRKRSPVGGWEFQKANSALQPQSTTALEAEDVGPSFVDSTALQLGSSQQNELATASRAGTVSQSFIHESLLLFNSNGPLVPNGLGEPSSNAEHSCPPGEEDGDDISVQLATGELGKKAELHEEVEAEEKTTGHEVPFPSQLVMEALEMALQEVPVGEACLEAGLLEAAEALNGIPSVDFSSMEEENGAAISPSAAAFEEDSPELHKSQREVGFLEGVEGSEDSGEANGGSEVCPEQQQEEAGMWVSWQAEPPSLQGTQLLKEERSPSTQPNKEGIVFDIPVADNIDCCNRTCASEQSESGNEQPRDVQCILERDEWEEGFKRTEPASQLDTEAMAILRGSQDSPQPGTSHPPGDHTAGAIGPELEEADGGAEDLEVVSTEALHLSEDEEPRALSSPSRESEECDFQAEMLEMEFLQAEEFAAETLSPINHLFYSAESHQEHHFLGIEQETPEEETSLPKRDSTLPKEEGREVDLHAETSWAEEAALREEHSAQHSLSTEPRATEEEEEEAGAQDHHHWEPQKDILGHEVLLEEGEALGKGDTMERKDMATLQDWTWEQQDALQQDNMGGVLRLGASTRDQGEETGEACQGDLPMEQQAEEEEEITPREDHGEKAVEACQGDLSMEQQVEEEEEITTREDHGEKAVEACQGDLSMEQQVEEEEEITTREDHGDNAVEACQGDLSMEQQVAEEEEITTREDHGDNAVEACQGDLSMEQQVAEEEEITTREDHGDNAVEACQGDLSMEQQVAEEEEITTREDHGDNAVEACQGDLSMEQQVEEEEEITTREDHREKTVEASQGDLSVEQQVEEEEEITSKREETIDTCQGDLPMQQQVEEEDEITSKEDHGEKTVEVCHGDLPMQQQVEEEEITTREDHREKTVEACQGDLSVEQQVGVEEEITSKREETTEACQGDLPMEQQVEEEEEITTREVHREKTVEACQGDLSVEQQVEDEEITGKGEQIVEACHGDLPMEQQVEEEIATKEDHKEKTIEACQGDLPIEQQVEDEEITSKKEETVEACHGDLSVEQQVEDEEITIKGEEAVEARLGDLPMEQQVEEDKITSKDDHREKIVEACHGDLSVEQQMEEITSKREETVEASLGDLPMQQQVEEEGITSKGEETIEVCQGDLSVEQQVEEGDLAVASPESDLLETKDLLTGPEAMEAEERESKTGLGEKAEPAGLVNMSEEQERLEAKLVSKTDTPQTEEQPVAAEREEASPNQHPLHFEPSLCQEASSGGSARQANAASGPEAKSCHGLEETGVSSENDPQLQSDHSGSEVSLESFDVSPNATREAEGIEGELESSRRINLEETLPDRTPLHLYDEQMLAGIGRDEEAAEVPLLTKAGAPSAEALEEAEEEETACLSSPQTEKDDARVLEGDEERGCSPESDPQQDAVHSRELPLSKDPEAAKPEELVREQEGGEAEMPSAEDGFPPLDAERDEQPGGVLADGTGAREELACGDTTHEEEMGSTGFVWETEVDSVFQPDQLDLQEGFRGGTESPLGFSDPNNIVSEGSHKVSPLTSVADLGEIVLEEEQTPEGTESEGLGCEQDGREGPGLESCGQEEPTREQTHLPELNSSGTEFADPSGKREASLPVDSLRDSDILEIVEQALEFNQEVIKAAEQTAEAEKWAAHGEGADSKGCSLAWPDVGRSQVPTEAPNAPSPNAKDPMGSSHLWVESNSNGLQRDPRLAEFTPELLNGLGGLCSGHRAYEVGSFGEELVEEFPPLQTLNEAPPQTRASEEAGSLQHTGQEGGDAGKSLFADRGQSAHAKGKDVEMGAIAVPPRFGEEILPLESRQHLKLCPEEQEGFWSPEDN